MTSTRNELEIQFFGLQRSGNHAVLAWIFSQFDVPVHFLNNVKKFEDPFLNSRSARLPNTVRLSTGPPGQDAASVANREHARLRLEKARTECKRLLCYSYEDFPIRQLAVRELFASKDDVIGRSGCVRRVLLLRDFYNWLASRIRLAENGNRHSITATDVQRLVSRWLTYAREFSGQTEFLVTENVVTISYNRWTSDPSYRADLLRMLEIPFKTDAIDHVPTAGGGSSFDGVIASDVIRSSVTERWRYLLEARFADLVTEIRRRRRHIDRYNRELFGLDAPF